MAQNSAISHAAPEDTPAIASPVYPMFPERLPDYIMSVQPKSGWGIKGSRKQKNPPLVRWCGELGQLLFFFC